MLCCLGIGVRDVHRPVKLFISVPAQDNGALTAEAIKAWDDFKQKIAHPLTAVTPQFGNTWLSAGRLAGVCRSSERNRAQIILEQSCSKKGATSKYVSTLLRECIHTDFAFGEHRDRWDKRQKRCEASHAEIRAMEYGDTPLELLKFIKRQRGSALTAIQLPDEIVAEQKMKRNYSPELFSARAAYHLKMQRRARRRNPNAATRQSCLAVHGVP